MKRGQILILGIVTLAVAMASYTCWHHYCKGYHALQFWGTSSAALIRHAKQVRLLKLQEGSGSPAQGQVVSNRFQIGEQEFSVVREVDISSARGLVHARHTLIEDQNFNWTSPPQSASPDWDFALQFSDRGDQETLLFDVQRRLVRSLGSGRQQMMTETMERIVDFLKPLLPEVSLIDD